MAPVNSHRWPCVGCGQYTALAFRTRCPECLSAAEKMAVESQRLAAASARVMPFGDVVKELRRIADALERAFPVKHRWIPGLRVCMLCGEADMGSENVSCPGASDPPLKKTAVMEPYCAGSNCSWHGPRSSSSSKIILTSDPSNTAYPVCPHCGEKLFEFPTREDFQTFARTRVIAVLRPLVAVEATEPCLSDWLSTPSKDKCMPLEDFVLKRLVGSGSGTSAPST